MSYVSTPNSTVYSAGSASFFWDPYELEAVGASTSGRELQTTDTELLIEHEVPDETLCMPVVPEAANTILDFALPAAWIINHGFVQCAKCELFFHRLAALDAHVKQSAKCQENWVAERALRRTSRQVPAAYACSMCKKFFGSRAKLRQHFNVHLKNVANESVQ